MIRITNLLHVLTRVSFVVLLLSLASAAAQQDCPTEFDNSCEPDVITPLAFAVQMGWLDEVRTLLKQDVDLEARNCSYGDQAGTALHEAVDDPGDPKELQILSLLLEAGADTNAVYSEAFGQTPLHVAGPRSLPIVKLLVKAGADVNAKTTLHATPLHRIVLHANANNAEHIAAIVEVLINAGADVNVEDCGTDTPLDIIERITMYNYEAREALLPVVKLLKDGGG